MRHNDPPAWDARLEDDCRQLIRLAVREDLERANDWTTIALVGREAQGRANVVARRAGVIAGLPALVMIAAEYDRQLVVTPHVTDGKQVAAGEIVAEIRGPARSLLTAERPMLNLLGHLSGIATLTAQYVEAIAGTKAHILDTRKTLPGWRRLEKYAVRCGGGFNHRIGLFDGVLIKDNHLALGADPAAGEPFTPATAVVHARQFVEKIAAETGGAPLPVEIEVDNLEQLDLVLPENPDIVLLDNMPPEVMAEAVRRRDAVSQKVLLEASGGIDLTTVAAAARSGVDRISVGAITHSAPWFDVALDWQ